MATKIPQDQIDQHPALVEHLARNPSSPAPAAFGRRSKYRNVITTYKGVRYSSKAEANRAEQLDRDLKAGLIRFWLGQPKFRLGCPENVYVADFLVIDFDTFWAEDVKGVRTAKFNKDVRLWEAYGPCELRIRARGKACETIVPRWMAEGRETA